MEKLHGVRSFFYVCKRGSESAAQVELIVASSRAQLVSRRLLLPRPLARFGGSISQSGMVPRRPSSRRRPVSLIPVSLDLKKKSSFYLTKLLYRNHPHFTRHGRIQQVQVGHRCRIRQNHRSPAHHLYPICVLAESILHYERRKSLHPTILLDYK